MLKTTPVASLLALVLAASCSSLVDAVRVGAQRRTKVTRVDAFSGGLSELTRSVLVRLGIDRDPWRMPCDGALLAMPYTVSRSALELSGDPVDAELAAAELSAVVASRSGQHEFWLECSVRARHALERAVARTAPPSRITFAESLHDGALGYWLEAMQQHVSAIDRWPGFVVEAGNLGMFRLDFAGGVSPSSYDVLLDASTFEVRGLAARHRRAGLGVECVGVRANGFDLEGRETNGPPEGIHQPVTAVVSVATDGRLVLALEDPFASEAVELSTGSYPLAADFTAPYAVLLSRTKLVRDAFYAMLDSDVLKRNENVYLMQPFDPERIPVLLVHGLQSSPLAWREVTNAIWGDPRLRARYQIWHYVYPTAGPVLWLGLELRRNLRGVRARFGLTEDDGMVVVGHSMGGLLCRTMLVDAGTAVWDELFGVPFESVQLDHADRLEIEAGLFLRPEPYIERATFICSPHRGSSYADNWVGRLGRALASPPATMKRIGTRVRRAVRAARLKLFGRDDPVGFSTPTSIDVLSPKHPVLRTTAALETVVPFHSIIGDVTDNQGSGGTDGIVTYESAHLEGAVSELVVRAPHDATPRSDVVREVRRILHLHLDELERARPQ